mmetsp:Transcript_34337/g.74179  ORF Transcript_34337/g.74179 Transcript_34337/m.74179 type:complete len:213 (+) Transcript_34337:298-936(+)
MFQNECDLSTQFGHLELEIHDRRSASVSIQIRQLIDEVVDVYNAVCRSQPFDQRKNTLLGDVDVDASQLHQELGVTSHGGLQIVDFHIAMFVLVDHSDLPRTKEHRNESEGKNGAKDGTKDHEKVVTEATATALCSSSSRSSRTGIIGCGRWGRRLHTGGRCRLLLLWLRGPSAHARLRGGFRGHGPQEGQSQRHGELVEAKETQKRPVSVM